MKTIKKRFTLALGLALLLQAAAPFISGVFLFDPLVDKTDIGKTMLNLAQHPFNAQLSIFLDIVAVMGVIWLGVLFYTLLQKNNKTWAMTGLGFYVLEAVMLLVGKTFSYALIRTSDLYLITSEISLLSTGQVLLQVEKFISSMAMIPFGVGAFLFYYLLVKSKALPTWISIWGLVSMFLVLFGIPLIAYGVKIPFAIVFPYVQFEFFIGGYVLIKGLREKALNDI
ncbi:MAG: hypothetical protein CVU42_16895 [Chloroflexi bacterium HGW-Chloroflexi-4]|jgi:hypothetical protein|nr:MAG: hypothetical protein CVU42_16895 [Chloroflexi bacterium HGW-Chloroflexi-4]